VISFCKRFKTLSNVFLICILWSSGSSKCFVQPSRKPRETDGSDDNLIPYFIFTRKNSHTQCPYLPMYFILKVILLYPTHPHASPRIPTHPNFIPTSSPRIPTHPHAFYINSGCVFGRGDGVNVTMLELAGDACSGLYIKSASRHTAIFSLVLCAASCSLRRTDAEPAVA